MVVKYHGDQSHIEVDLSSSLAIYQLYDYRRRAFLQTGI